MRLFVPLTKTEFDALRELARIERRRPQDQAAAMLARVLADDSTSPHPNDITSSQQTPRRETQEVERVSAA